MARYDYYTAVTNDVIDGIRESISGGYLDTREYADHEALLEHLNDALWTADNVTGNGSGSYTFNSARAAEYVTDNADLVLDMVRDYGIDAATVGEHYLNGDWEWFDVSLRCYVLMSAIDDALDALEESGEITYADAGESALA